MPRAFAMLLAAVLFTSCQNPHAENRRLADGEAIRPGSSVQDYHQNQAYALLGYAKVENYGNLCAGHVKLEQGSATVTDLCFSGDSNVVLCTDVTAANPVRCTPGKGTLSVGGTGNDEIAYARMK